MRELDDLAQTKLRVLAEIYVMPGSPRVFIETGTAGATTVQSALEVGYDLVVSIELNHGFYRMAAQRYLREPRVRILHGDSALLLQDALAAIQESAVILLDAHYTGGPDDVRGDGDTPVLAELVHISHHPHKHVVLIDDARLFGTDPEYPTVEQINDMMGPADYAPAIIVDDIIRLVPFPAPEPAE